jgi:uncharacterized protein (TIGR03000 family)
MYRLTTLVIAVTFAAGVIAGVLLAQPGGPVVPPDKAVITVKVPADAVVTIDGKPTTQKGPERVFITPPLDPKLSYALEFTATWKDKEQKSVKRIVEFKAGQSKRVDFTQPEPPKDKKPEVKDKKPEVKDKKPDSKDKKTEPKQAQGKSRSFYFTYAGKVKDLPAGAKASIWLPMASTNAQQEVVVASQEIPGDLKIGQDKQYGNSIAYFEGKANDKGEIPFEISYKVTRREVKTDVKGNLLAPVATDEPLSRYHEPDVKVPIAGKPLALLKENLKDKTLPKDPFAAAKVMYDVVNSHMTYKKNGPGWGQGDAVWACDSKYGNCTDFHSLFISMARGNKIASKFEMGFSIPTKAGSGPIGGYHCWAWFALDSKGWIPVDISEANQHPDRAEYYFGNIGENRVAFSVGRDIDLSPVQKGPPLNFFIYPYVEVGGNAYPAEKVERAFSYRDVP